MNRPALLAIDTSTEFCSVAVCIPTDIPARGSAGIPSRTSLSAIERLTAITAGAGTSVASAPLLPDVVFDIQSSEDVVSGLRFFSLDVHTGAVSSTYILPAIDAVLNAAGLSLADCGALAFGAGPGSFTGLRTATGIAQGLAFGADLPVVPVDTLMACAESARLRGTVAAIGTSGTTDAAGDAGDASNACRYVLAAIDARMGECYWEAFEWSKDGGWVAMAAAQVGPPELAVAPWPPSAAGYALVGNAVLAFGDRVGATAEAQRIDADARPSGIAVASIGWRDWQAGQAVPPAQALPRYVRDKVALTTCEREVERAERAERARSGAEGVQAAKSADRAANP